MTKQTWLLTTWEVLNIVEALKERANRWEREGVDTVAIEHLRVTMRNIDAASKIRVEK